MSHDQAQQGVGPDKEKTHGKFELKKITKFSSLAEEQYVELPESDLCFQDKENIYQFKFIEPPEQEDEKYLIKPGIFAMSLSHDGVVLSKLELRKRNLLESAVNTSKILKEARLFFSKLHIYEKLGRPKKRSVLLYSKPGMGKSSTIEKFCDDALSEDPGTVVMMWPTSAINADDVSRFLSTGSEYTDACTRVILIIEDIGGGEREGSSGVMPVDSGLLNLLDGVGVTFKLPTFVIATTNYPENLLSALADRPGRFDLMMRLSAPSFEEKIRLMEFISRRVLSDEEKTALGKKGTEEFSIAHLEEIAVRAELHDKTYSQVIDELIEHHKLFNRDFEENSKTMSII